MKSPSNKQSPLETELKQLDRNIHWQESRKNQLEQKVITTFNRRGQPKARSTTFKYPLSIVLLLLLLGGGYFFMTTSLSDEATLEEENTQVPEVTTEETNQGAVSEQLDVEGDTAEMIVRKVEGMDQEVQVISYHIEPYGISFQLDESFGSPEVQDKQVIYTYLEDYSITLEILEHTNLEHAVAELDASFESEGYDESFGIEDTPLEENNLRGKMQFYDSPVKGFIAYEIGENVLAITFRYPVEAGDGMYPLLQSLRESIKVE